MVRSIGFGLLSIVVSSSIAFARPDSCRDVFTSLEAPLTNGADKRDEDRIEPKLGQGKAALPLRAMYKFLNWSLKRRYDIKVEGLEEVYKKGDQGIVFFFEHPALIDPVILYSQVGSKFSPRPIVAESQNKGVRKIAFGKLNARFIPEVGPKNPNAGQQIKGVYEDIVGSLGQGQNWVLAPAGQLKRTHLDQIRGKKMAADLIRDLPPGARVVLVTSKGLWGSSFGFGQTGESPKGPPISGDLVAGLVKDTLPKRQVQLAFEEISPEKLAQLRAQGRDEVNEYLESKINRVEQENVYVPLTHCAPACVLPDPVPSNSVSEDEKRALAEASKSIPTDLRADVVRALTEILPEEKSKIESYFGGSDHAESLALELKVDSLGFVELVMDLEKKLGFELEGVVDGSADQFLLSVYKAKIGGTKSAGNQKKRVDLRFYRYAESEIPREIPEGNNILAVFYKKARENPDAPWMSDENGQVLTYREGVAKTLLISRMLAKLPGKNVGIMLPPSPGATLMFFGALQARKIPAMVNYTAGNENLKSSMDMAEVRSIVTSKIFVKALQEKKFFVDSIENRFVYSEDLIAKAGEKSLKNATRLAGNILTKGAAASRTLWPRGNRLDSEDIAALIFTSGSSSAPKAVPLSHRNILQNIRDLSHVFALTSNDSVLGMAPPFHSLGLTGTVVMPALSGVRVAYYPNGTDGRGIAKAVESFKSTFIIGTPTVLRQNFQAANQGQLDSLRIIVSGGEALNAEVANYLKSKAPNAVVLEGAGATETSPVWAINPVDDARLGWVGKILPSLKYDLVDNDSLNKAIAARDESLIKVIPMPTDGTADGARQGELVLSGDSVITHYYNNLKPEAFFTWKGETFYRTEDLVLVTADGWAQIKGRFSRQHKAPGGEMVNHQIIEDLLARMPELSPKEDGKPTMWIGVGKTANGELLTTLVTNRSVSLDEVNKFLTTQKIGPTWYVKRVIKVDEIPLLGTGKVDGRSCNEMIKKAFAPTN